MQLGASFSHRHLDWLKLDKDEALKEFKNLGLKWIRLGAYWNEIEGIEDQYSFNELERLVKFCEKKSISIILSVGMKAQRHPEYYIPEWLLTKLDLKRNHQINTKDKLLLDHTLKFIDKTVTHFKGSSAIKIWQVENEPLDAPDITNGWTIDLGFFRKEVGHFRKLDTRPLMSNFWGNHLSKRNYYEKVVDDLDAIGFDIYLKRPLPLLGKTVSYLGPLESKDKYKQISDELHSKGKQFFITELQAEPWEIEGGVSDHETPPSFLPEQFEKNLNYARDINPDVVLLWGFEYWLWRKTKGDNRYWDEAKKAIKNI